MLEPQKLVRPHIRSMQPYTPILPFDIISEKLGIPAGDILKLDANENPYGPLPKVIEALGSMAYVHIYPDPESRTLRKAISAHYELPVENVLAGSGADELIDLLMRVLLDPGDSILDCPPTFGMYAFDAGAQNARVISVPRRYDFQLDLDRIEAVIESDKPKVLFLANPNNPDGGLLPLKTLERLMSLPILLVLDEAYVDFAPPGTSILSKLAESGQIPDNLVALRTFSKWAGLAGLRVGFGVFPDWLMPHLWLIKQPYNVSVAASRAALVSLENTPQLDANRHAIVSERKRLMAALQDIPWLKPYPSQANFILCRVIGRDAAQLKADLSQGGILIRYFNKPGLRDHIRISIGKPEHTPRLINALMDWGRRDLP